jgi:hypothetical protein
LSGGGWGFPVGVPMGVSVSGHMVSQACLGGSCVSLWHVRPAGGHQMRLFSCHSPLTTLRHMSPHPALPPPYPHRPMTSCHQAAASVPSQRAQPRQRALPHSPSRAASHCTRPRSQASWHSHCTPQRYALHACGACLLCLRVVPAGCACLLCLHVVLVGVHLLPQLPCTECFQHFFNMHSKPSASQPLLQHFQDNMQTMVCCTHSVFHQASPDPSCAAVNKHAVLLAWY